MPIYEYRCKKCDHRFDLMRRLAERDNRAVCPECGSRATARMTIQRFAMVTGAEPDAFGGEGEAEDFMGGGDHGHDDLDMDDFDF